MTELNPVAAYPLLIEFVAPTTLLRERDRPSTFTIVGNGPPGTFVIFPSGLRVSLPTDQIVFADDASGRARVGFGGMQFVGIQEGQLVCLRVREVLPEALLSPARSHRMELEPSWIASMFESGQQVWPAPADQS